MKRRITVTVDDSLYRLLKLDGKNVSRFINGLLEQEAVGTHREKLSEALYKEIYQKMMKDEQFFKELSERVIQKTRGY